MAENSKIGWTKHTWNPWRGCNHVSAGCTFCYADRHIHGRYKQDFKHLTRASKHTFNLPHRLNVGMSSAIPFTERLVFPCSLSDFFHKQADAWRPEAWAIIRATPHLIYQITTKRPERIRQCLPADWGPEGYPNVWLGVSIESQDVAAERLAHLLRIPARIHWVSAEPLLGPLNLRRVVFTAQQAIGFGDSVFEEVSEMQVLGDFSDFDNGIDWVVIGGESGNDNGEYLYRPCELEWIESLMRQCVATRTKIFVKQTGTHLSKQLGLSDRHGTVLEEWPEQLRVQQFPTP